jgi:hypothetical protein
MAGWDKGYDELVCENNEVMILECTMYIPSCQKAKRWITT